MGKKKTFKTIDEQIDILKSKGIIIRDIEQTKYILYRENYFFISGYRHLFMRRYNDKNYIEGTTFEELYATFMFDRAIRNIIFKYILIVENNIKSILSYQLSKKYGYREKDYLCAENFTKDAIRARQVKDVLNKMKRQIRVNGKQHIATSHYLNSYGYIPLWILVKVISFGIISELYSILKNEDKLDIAEYYDIVPEDLSNYLSLLSNFRNRCAHEDILYEHRTQKEIRDNRFHEELHIKRDYEGTYEYGKNDLLAIMIILKQMLTKDEFIGLVFEIGYEIDVLDGKVDVVPLEDILGKMGFPANWRDLEGI